MGKFTNKSDKSFLVQQEHWNHFTDEQKEKIRENYPKGYQGLDIAFDKAVNELNANFWFRLRVSLAGAWLSEDFWKTFKECWRSW